MDDRLISLSEESLKALERFHDDLIAFVKIVKALVALAKRDVNSAERYIAEAEDILEGVDEWVGMVNEYDIVDGASSDA